MNKYFLKSIIAVALSAMALTSCELDQFDPDNLQQTEAWSDANSAKKFQIGLMSALRSVSGGGNDYITDVQADLFNVRVGGNIYNDVHDWSFKGTASFSGDGIWYGNYSLILTANDILQHVDAFINNENTTAIDLDFFTKMKGQAFFARAYAYNNLIVRYAKDYEPDGSAATELGLPLVTVPDREYRPARATLQETCDFIQNDIDSARVYLEEYPGTNEPDVETLDALESRFALYTHNFDKAIQLSKALVVKYPLCTPDNLQNLWVFDEGSEIIYMPVQTSDELAVSAGGLFTSYDIRSDINGMGVEGVNPAYVPTQGLLDLYGPGDVRYDIYFTNFLFGGQDLPIIAQNDVRAEGKCFWKFIGNPNLTKDPSDLSNLFFKNFNMAKPFRSSEQYMIAAEANLRKADRNEAEARKYLNLLREARAAAPIEDGVSGEDLDKEMRDEWTREFVGEGFRLDNLKRWHTGFKRMQAQPFRNPILTKLPGFQDLEVPADHKKFVWEIPFIDRTTNPNLKPNW